MQTNPLNSPNPCPIPRETKQLGKGRGLTAWDLLKEKPVLKVKRSQKEIQQANRPQFDHPKILHVLIDRANGFGCKTLAKRHGGSPAQISKFCKEMGFGQIKRSEQLLSNGEKHRKADLTEAYKLMESERKKDSRQERKYDEQNHWSGQSTKEFCAWYARNRYANDIQYRIASNINGHLSETLKKGYFSSKRLKAVLGCTVAELIEHLESKFLDGMTWDNQGNGPQCWQIDHLIPKSWFNQEDPEQFAKCWHYSNLHPAWRTHNYRKGNRFGEEVTESGFQSVMRLT